MYDSTDRPRISAIGTDPKPSTSTYDDSIRDTLYVSNVSKQTDLVVGTEARLTPDLIVNRDNVRS